MSYVRLCNFIDIYRLRADGSQEFSARYQNGYVGELINFNGANYEYLSFVYQGAAKSRTGDNLEAAIVLSVNAISQDIARQAVMRRKHVTVYSVVTESSTFNPNGNWLSREVWLAATMTYDAETLEVILSSGIDAVGANAPSRVLTKGLVGRLPTTANINAG
jgi:hypothetical protein